VIFVNMMNIEASVSCRTVATFISIPFFDDMLAHTKKGIADTSAPIGILFCKVHTFEASH